MNCFEKLLYFLQGTMNEPTAFGWFHLLWIAWVIISIIALSKLSKSYNEKQLKIVLAIYGIIALLLEITKQLIWSFNYDPELNIVSWKYQWYAAPFQLCTTPIYISLISIFLKKGKFRDALLSYLSFVTILGSLMTILIPDSCFTSDILINIHTMWLHCGSFIVSIYLLMTEEVKVNKNNLLKSFLIFIIFVVLAEILNITIYNIGILNGDAFNMFYISPYFISTLPVYNVIQENLPFILFLLFYIATIFIGSILVYFTAYLIKKYKDKLKLDLR